MRISPWLLNLSLAMSPGIELFCFILAYLTWQTEGALNVEQVLEDAVLRLRERVYISDGLVYKAPSAACDSLADGPHCPDSPTSAVTDGIFSTRLLSSSNGGEMLDEYFLGASLKEVQTQRTQRSKPQVKAPSRVDRGSLKRGRSALLSFRGMQPFLSKHFLPNFAGVRRLGQGIPFQVHWEGPWELVPNPSFENDQVKRGRFVAQLQGPVGKIRFGRPVSLQSVDLCRGPKESCAIPTAVKPPTPLVVKGRHAGAEVFNEVVPNWDLRTYVNGVAFFALTSTELVDEIVFIMAECILIGAIQLSFTSNPQKLDLDVDPQQREVPLYLTMREGWHASGWEEIEFRIPSAVHDLPVWNLNEVSSRRLSIRPGVFELPPQSAADAPFPGLSDFAATAEKEEEQELLEQVADVSGDDKTKISVGPEPIAMPSDLEEILDTGTPLQDIVDVALAYQRNASVLISLISDQLELNPELLLGLDRRLVNDELLRLLEAMLEALEGKRTASVAQTPSEMTDFLWRQLNLDILDTLFLRYHSWRYHDALRTEQTTGIGMEIDLEGLDLDQSPC